jgi:hypothetical protein
MKSGICIMIADIFGVLVLFGIGTYMWISVPENQSKQPIFNIQDGKQRSLQAKGDAGLYIEKVRRRTIQQVGRLDPRKLRETRTQFGSATGVIETFMITGICDPLPCICPPDILFDGGGPRSEFCPASGNLDAGNYQTKVCEDCPPDTLFDGGGTGSNFKTITGSGTLDAGNQPICESCPPDTIFDGGGAGANFKTIKGSGILDGKFHNTKACGI